MYAISPRLISLHCHYLDEDIHVLGFNHCWSLYYAYKCGAIHMCVTNIMVLLCAMVHIVRVYICIRDFIWLGFRFSFVLMTLCCNTFTLISIQIFKGGERVPEHYLR
jgi:hypothetical protein